MKFIYIIPFLFFTMIGCKTFNIISQGRVIDYIEIEDNVDQIEFFFKGKKVGEMTKEELQATIKAGGAYNKEIEAEISDPRRLEVIFLKKPWIIKKTKNKYRANILINWYEIINNKKEVFKSLNLTLDLILDKSNQMSKWRIMYRNISEVGFPISTGLVILIILLIIFI